MELKSLKNNIQPLKDLALRRISIHLWDRPDMYAKAAQWNSKELESYPRELPMNKFSSLIINLQLPESLKTELAFVIKGVYREFTKWLNFHEIFLQLRGTNHLLSLQNLEHIMWTSLGTINYKKTAELLIRHRNLDVIHRYRLACLHCFHRDIQNLRRELPIESQVDLKGPEGFLYYPRNIVAVWTFNLTRKVLENEPFVDADQNSRICKHCFRLSAMQGLRSATEYFFENLTEEQKRDILVYTIISVVKKCAFGEFSYASENQQCFDVLCYLLSVTVEHELMYIIRSYSFKLLKCLLHWARIDIFNEVAELAFPYFTQSNFRELLYVLYKNITVGYNYLQLVLNLLENRPNNFSNYPLLALNHFFEYYTEIVDIKSLNLIFKYLNTEERAFVVLSPTGTSNVYYLAKREKWDVIKLYLCEAKLHIKDRRKLVRKVLRHEPKLRLKMRKQFTKLLNKFDDVPLP